MSYLPRAIDKRLQRLLNGASAIAVEGPKGVGKTETAAQHATTILRLDTEVGRELYLADPSFASLPDGTILIDEWQKRPSVWDAVRRAVDDGAPAGRFLLTGSATPASDAPMHSGAGRILSLRMRPMAIFERGRSASPSVSMAELLQNGDNVSVAGASDVALSGYLSEMARSGFPAISALPDADLREEHLDAYISRIAERELPDQGYTARNAAALRAWLRAYAAATSTDASYTSILDASTPGVSDKPSRSTTDTFRAKLEEIWVLDPLPAWNFAHAPLSRLATSPKHHLADPALAMRLLGLNARSVLLERNAQYLGPLFESLATLSVRVAAEANRCRVGHLRSLDGTRDIDLIVEDPDGMLLAFEVKLAGSVGDRDVRHLNWLQRQVGDSLLARVVLYTGERAYKRPDGVLVVPLAMLGA
ncbi:MAG: ATP-binding protein [Microbacteriaceae bacterium]|nr:ATP-binding protein [Microbacteriaceae bacterium]